MPVLILSQEASTGFFSRNVVWGENRFCGERKCEKHPKNKQNLLLFGEEIFPPKGPEKKHWASRQLALSVATRENPMQAHTMTNI